MLQCLKYNRKHDIVQTLLRKKYTFAGVLDSDKKYNHHKQLFQGIWKCLMQILQCGLISNKIYSVCHISNKTAFSKTL